MTSRQVKYQLSLGLTPEKIAGLVKLEPYNRALGCQTVYRLIKRSNGPAFSCEKENVIVSVQRLESTKCLVVWILMNALTMGI